MPAVLACLKIQPLAQNNDETWLYRRKSDQVPKMKIYPPKIEIMLVIS